MTLPVALITGAARRLGAEITRQLHDAGYRVLVHYRESSLEAHSLVAELNDQRPDSAHSLPADLHQQADVRQLAERALASWGRLDLLINNASSFYATPFTNATPDDWDDLMASNLKAPFFLCQALCTALKDCRGCVINIADIHGQRPLANHAIYSIAKAGNIMLTKSLALELAPEVRVNGIAPGAMLWPETTDPEQGDPGIVDQIPLGELGGAAAIAEAVLYLARHGRYVTGHILTVDGGRSLRQ